MTAAASAQSAGGLFLVNGLGGTVKSLNATGDLVNSYSVACDPYDDTILWVGTSRATTSGTPSLYRVQAVAGRILAATRVNVPLSSQDFAVQRIQVLGHRLLFLTQTQLAIVPLAGGTPTVEAGKAALKEYGLALRPVLS